MVKTPGTGPGKAVRGPPRAWEDRMCHALGSLLRKQQYLVWAGKTLFGSRCADTFFSVWLHFCLLPSSPGLFPELLVVLVGWWLWAGTSTPP